jgi:hypothetical protein
VVQAIDGSSKDQTLVTEDGPNISLVPGAWLGDARIVYMSAPTADLGNVEIKLLEPGAKAGRVVVPLGVGSSPAVSPDARQSRVVPVSPERPGAVGGAHGPDHELARDAT